MGNIVRLISLITLSLLTFGGCDSPLEPEAPHYDFGVDNRLGEADENGYFHMDLSDFSAGEQSLIRFTATTNNPEIQFVWWDCTGYWVYEHMGEEFVVPIINHSSYTDYLGEANTMFAPHISMVGDTVTVNFGYVDSIHELEYHQVFDVILDE
jgi:hypothetical protein